MELEAEVRVSDEPKAHELPVSFVPTPSMQYRTRRKEKQTLEEPGKPKLAALPVPLPVLVGPRALIWKQDPSVAEIGVRKTFLPGFVQTGPKDARIVSQGLPAVSANAFGDFIQTPNTDAFDAVHTFAIVRQTLTMYQRAMGGAPLPWRWNSGTNTDPLNVFAHGLPNTMNAFYHPGLRALKFGDFIPPGTPAPPRVFTCRSFDIVAHETGHAILDGLKPGWLSASSPPQTGGLHESFGDLTAIFLALSQLDQVEAIIAHTKANLHNKTFLADLAEQFGLALGRPNGLRNADNDLKLSEAGTEVHAISQVFTGGIYDVLADVFVFERNPSKKDDAIVLYEVGKYLCSLVLRALIAAPATNATYAHVVNAMLNIANSDGKPVQYRNFIRNRFTLREVVVSPTPFAEDIADDVELMPAITDASDAVQDRSTCCGTMQLDEVIAGEEYFAEEIEELKLAFAKPVKQLSKAGSGNGRHK